MRLTALWVALAAVLAGGDLRNASGVPVSLPELLARGPVVLVFWNSWLPHADEFATLLPDIEAAASRYGWPGAVIVFQERRADAQQPLPALKGPLPFVFDRRGELLRRFQVTRAPAVLLVETNGSVRGRCGPDAGEVRAIIQEMARR